MNVVKEIQRINQREISSGQWTDTGSWHAQYKDTAWIFAGGLPYDLTEGDFVCIFSQYGEIIHIELIRDHKTGKSKGFAFLQYEDQRSTILAVDNLNGATVLGRTIRVDHSYGPKKQKKKEGEEESDDDQPKMNVAPQMIEVIEKEKPKPKPVDMDEEDPMAAYFKDKKEKKSKKKKEKSGSSSRHHKHKEERSRRRDEDDRSSSKRSISPYSRRDRSPSDRRRSYRDDRSPPRRSYRSRSRSNSPPRRSRYRSRSPRRSRSPSRRSRSPCR